MSCSLQGHKQQVQTKWLQALQVALLSMTATAVGLDFSCATRVIFAEVPPTVDVLQQAEGRAHRAKTRFPVNAYVLLCEQSRDVRAWLRLSESLERTASLIEADYTGALLVISRGHVLAITCTRVMVGRHVQVQQTNDMHLSWHLRACLTMISSLVHAHAFASLPVVCRAGVLSYAVVQVGRA